MQNGRVQREDSLGFSAELRYFWLYVLSIDLMGTLRRNAPRSCRGMTHARKIESKVYISIAERAVLCF